MNVATQELTQIWSKLQTVVPIGVIYSEQQYQKAINTINQLLDIIQDDEAHPLYSLLET